MNIPQSQALFENQPRSQFLSVRELAAQLQVPPATIRDWVYRRRVPFYKLGRHVRFATREIGVWLNERRADGHRTRE